MTDNCSENRSGTSREIHHDTAMRLFGGKPESKDLSRRALGAGGVRATAGPGGVALPPGESFFPHRTPVGDTPQKAALHKAKDTNRAPEQRPSSPRGQAVGKATSRRNR